MKFAAAHSIIFDEFIIRCFSIGSELPLPLWERVGVRGSGLSIDRNPSPGSLRDPTSPFGRGEAEHASPYFSPTLNGGSWPGGTVASAIASSIATMT